MRNVVAAPPPDVQVFRTPYPHLLVEVLRTHGVEAAVCDTTNETTDGSTGHTTGDTTGEMTGEPEVDSDGHLVHVADHDATRTTSLAARNCLPVVAHAVA